MEKFLENLEKAKNIIQTADHLTYMTFPLVSDKKLLLKIISEIRKGVANCINSILQYEYLYKRISLHKEPKTNFKTFQEKCATKYGITPKEVILILELFEIVEEHEKSPMEFVKDEKVVILSENMKQKTLTVEKTKEFLVMAKNIFRKTENYFLRKV